MIIYLIIILSVVTRFIPHMPNLSIVTALGIFSAVYLSKKEAIAIPLAVRFVSDIFLGFFSWPLMVAVYAAHLVGVLFGLWIRKSSVPMAVIPSESDESRNRLNLKDKGSFHSPSDALRFSQDDNKIEWFRIVASSLGSSIIFFLVTNFAYLYAEYPHNFTGVMLAYTNGLPFLRGTILGDLGYSLALFGSLALVQYAIKSKNLKLVKI